jgi:hypothetical protein
LAIKGGGESAAQHYVALAGGAGVVATVGVGEQKADEQPRQLVPTLYPKLISWVQPPGIASLNA